MKRRLLAAVLCLSVLATATLSLLWYQRKHPEPTKAAMEWDRNLIIEGDDIQVGDFDYDILDANTMASAFIDQITGDVWFARSDDGGETWQREPIATADGEQDTTGNTISLDMVNTNVIFVAYIGQTLGSINLASTTDGGSTWNIETIESGGEYSEAFVDAFDANNVSVVFNRNLGTDVVLAVSSNGGDSFSTLNVFSDSTCSNCPSEGVQMASASKIFVSYVSHDLDEDLYVAVSNNGGASIASTTLVEKLSEDGTGQVTGLSAFDVNTVAVCYVDFTDSYQHFAISTNGGSSFTRFDVDTTDLSSATHECSIDLVSATNAVIAYHNDSGVTTAAITTNGGSSWSLSEPTGGYMYSMSVKALNATDVYVGSAFLSSAILAATSNSGTAWTEYGIVGQNSLAIATMWPSSNRIFHGYYNGIGKDFWVATYDDLSTTWDPVLVDGTDGGDTSNFVNGSSPNDSDAFFIYRDGSSDEARVAYTSDDGATWNTTNITGTEIANDSLAIHSLDGDTVDVLLYDNPSSELRYYRSTDGAASWSLIDAIATGVGINQTNIQRVDDNFLFFSYHDLGDGNVWSSWSDDNGATWNDVQVTVLVPDPATEVEMIFENDVLYISVYDADSSVLNSYRSTDSGLSFDGPLEIESVHAGPLLDLTASGDTVVWSWVDTNTNQLHYAFSNDGADQYHYRAVPDYPNSLAYQFRPQIALDGPDTLRTAYQSESDFGSAIMSHSYLGNIDDWNYTDVYGGGGSNSDFVAVNETLLFTSFRDVNTGELYVARSSNGGVDWDSYFYDSSATQTSIDAPTESTVFVAYNYAGGGPFDDLWLAKSIDGGENVDTYTEVNPGFAGDVGGPISLDAFDEDTLFVAYTNVNTGALWFAYSTDGGASFTNVQVDSDGQVGGPDSVHAVDENIIFISFADQFGALYYARSDDGGATWDTGSIDSNANGYNTTNAIEANDENNVHVVYGNGTDAYFATTSDGGDNWDIERQFNNTGYDTGNYLSIEMTDSDHLYISALADSTTNLYLFSSPDAGDTWNAFALEQSGPGEYSQVQAVSDDYIFVSGYSVGGENLRVFRSSAPSLVAPSIIRPQDGSVVTNDVVLLSAWYEDSAVAGVTNYRVSSSSTQDCIDDIDIIFSDTSPTTESASQPTLIEFPDLLHGTTYYWCAQNDNTTVQTAWTEMGEFETDFTQPKGIVYSTFLGGSSTDIGNSIAIDSGDVYVSGQTYSTDFPATSGAFSESNAGDRDVFVAKLSPDGNGTLDLIYATYVGGAQDDAFGWQYDAIATQLAVDAGRAYVATSTFSTDFPTTIGAYDTTKDGGTGNSDVGFFVVSAAGDDLDYSTYLGGTIGQGDYQDGIDVDSGLAYIGGTTLSAGFPSTAGSYDPTHGGNGQTFAFIVVIDPAGGGVGDLDYGTFLGHATGPTDANDIDFDDGLVYIVGYTIATGYPTASPVGTPYETTHGPDSQDAYLSVVDPSGNGAADLVYSTFLGGNQDDRFVSVVAEDGLIYAAGQASDPSGFPFTSGAYQEFVNGSSDATLSIFDPAGNGSNDLLYSTAFGGSQGETFFAAQPLSDGRVAAIGYTDSSDTETTVDTEQVTPPEGLIVIIDPQGDGSDDLVYADYVFGESDDSLHGVAYDGDFLYLVGNSFSADYPAGALGGDAYDITINGDSDAVITVFDLGLSDAPPADPVLRFPDDGSVRAGVVVLSALYEHHLSVGTTDYRVSTSSTSDCVNNINVVDSGTSATTTDIVQATLFETVPLPSATYYWCARNDDGSLQTDWIEMGSFIKDYTAPYMNYMSYIGGAGVDSIFDFDLVGSTIYFVGTTDSTDLPTTPGVVYETPQGGGDFFVGAFETNGSGVNDLVYLSYFGGSGSDNPFGGIKHDGSSVYITGTTSSADFPVTGSAYDSVLATVDGYALKLDEDGTTIEYATYLGGTSTDSLIFGEVEAGIMYLGGSTANGTFPTTAGAYDTSYNGGLADAVFVILNPAISGSGGLVYSTFFGGSSNDSAFNVDHVGGLLYFAGDPFSSNVPTTGGSYDTSNNGAADLVFGRLNPAGGGASDLQYSTFVGGSSNEFLNGLFTDQSTGELYATGVATTGFPTTAGAIDTISDGSELFVVKFDTSVSGSGALEYSTYLGGDNIEFADGIVFDGTDIFVAGGSSSENSPVTTATAYGNHNVDDGFSTEDGFLVRLTPAGNGASDLLYGSYFGVDSIGERFTSLAVDGEVVYLAGFADPYTFESFADPGTPFDSTPNDFDQDGFIMRLDFAGGPDDSTFPPNAPTLVYPDNGAARAGITNLAALYSHASLSGSVDFRVSNGSAANCLANVNIVASGSSPSTSSNNETATFEVEALPAGTYNWCARNDTSFLQSAWTTMGSYIQNNAVPYLNYQSYLGGNGADRFDDLYIESGDIYFAATVESTNFPGTIGVYDTTHNGNQDAMIGAMSLDGNGSSDMLFATYLGSSANESGHSVKYVGGKIYGTASVAAGTTIPTTGGAYDTTFNGFTDIYAFRLASDGSALEYATFIGAANIDVAYLTGVVGGVMYMAGTAQSTGFPTTAGAYDSSFNGFSGVPDGVFVVLNPAGGGATDLVYGSYYGSTSQDFLYAKRLVGTKFYFALQAGNTVPTTAGAFDTTMNGGQDSVLGVFNPAGSGAADLEYATYYGGSSNEFTLRMDTDTSDNTIVVTGYTASNNLPTTAGAYDESAASGIGATDGYIVKMNPAGAGAADLVYATYIESDGTFDFLNQIFVADGDIYISGSSDSANFPVTSGAYSNDDATGGTRPLFLVLNPGGAGAADLLYATYFNIAGSTYSAGNVTTIAVDGDLVYLAGLGSANAYEVIADPGTPFDATHNGSTDAFITRFDMSGGPFVPPSGGGGGGGNQAQQQQPSSLGVPAIGPVNVLGSTSVLFNFTYNGSNQTGFRLLNEQNQAVVQVANSIATTVTETGLQHNSLVTGRKVAAYNATTQGLASSAYPDVYTHIIPVTPSLVSRVDDRIRVRVNESPNNLIVGQSGIRFELMQDGDLSASAIVQSPWVQTTDYVFSGTVQGESYYVRSRSRNAAGIETPWSNNVLVEGEELIEDVELLVGLSLVTSEGLPVEGDRLLNPNELLYGEMTVMNNGSTMADNVFLALPLPQYLSYLPGSLSVDGARQSDAADMDAGQATNKVIAAIWPTLDFAFGHTVRFTLAFDTPRLVEDFIKPVETDLQEIERELGEQIFTEVRDLPKEPLTAPEISREDFIDPDLDRVEFNESTEALRNVLAQAIAAAGPQLTIQASASHAGDPQPSYSNPVTAQPDLAVIADAPVAAPAPAPGAPLPPAPVPTPEETQTIEGILEGEFFQPSSGTPALQTGDTTSSFDNGSFSIGVEALQITGTAIANDDQIEFTGTTSQPFTVITLIFNDSITAIAVSDQNGEWRTFVDAETLGIHPGQQADVRIEAIAAKGELRSERVSVGEVTVTRGVDGEVVAEFDTIVSENAFVTAINEIGRETIQVIQEQEPAIQTALTAAAPVLVVSSVPLWGYLPYVPTLLYHFIIWLLGVFGRKKKDDEQTTYGVIYDAITKLPLPLAIVRVYSVIPSAAEGSHESNQSKLVTTVVTDKAGRYDVLLAPGTYRLEVSKPQYQFPSQIVTTTIDGKYDRVYQANAGMAVQEQSLVIPQVPIDPVNVQRDWELSFGIRKVWLAVQRVGHYLATPLLLVGSLSSALLVIASPDRIMNWVIVVLYVGLLASHLKLKPKAVKAWGVVYDIATNATLPLTTIQLIEPAYNKVVTSRLTDYQGRFSFLPEPGQYVVKANKPGYEQVKEVVESKYKDRQPMSEQVHVDKPDQRIAGDVAMRQSS